MTPPRRKLWLDWQRGLAVLFMIEVHVLDAWLASDARSGAAYHALRMLGGFAAPGFLYMAGLSQALADRAAERKGVPAAARRTAALRRALWLLGVAYGFRAVELVVGGAWRRADGWTDLVRVDVLNVIAVGLMLSALLSVGRPARTGALLAGAAALAIALATPVVADVLRHYDVPTGGVASEATRQAPNRLVDVLLAYLYASWPRANFHLFNWAGFLLAGAAVAPLACGERRPWLWLGAAAALLALGSWADRWPPVYAYQHFWRTSPSWFAMRLAVCLGLTGALQLLPDAAERGLGWLTLLGRQSLVAYIASVELTYGALASPLKGALSFPATVFGISAMAALTWAISLAWERYRARRRRAGGQRGPGGAGTPLSRAGL
ncbi:MAG TPA: heparan-alpha-glucosaminide N-acetyltransferase domain-containing protein [Anaeromyxobacter sp.]|nr:heparan-alpha-glucosaminide N-acetyltransferase domain-containing protein [Anaeromyxobacter sp.]